MDEYRIWTNIGASRTVWINTRLADADKIHRLHSNGHLEKFKVPAQARDGLPFSST
jgi:hypothetical protein